IILLGTLSLDASVFAPIGGGVRALTIDQEREELEERLQEQEEQSEEYRKTVDLYKKKGTTLQGEINRLQAKISAINGQIGEINTTLGRINSQIQTATSRINETQGKIDRSKGALAGIIRRVNKDDKKGLIDILLENPSLSDFFINVNDLIVVQENLKETLDSLGELKGELITQKELLALERSDVEVLRLYQVRQRQEVEEVKAEQDQLLAVTKGQESAYQTLLVQTEQTAAEIRASIFRLLGGGQMTFEEAYKFAKFAEQRTGVRAALILAVLDRESALGRNVGQCTYHTAMAPGPPQSSRDDVTPFLQITKELGLDPETQVVSCPIVADGAYGGAMGPAQFIPSTWVAYKDRVAALTGSRPASPWRNLDAFVASGLYLKDAGAATNEIAAAARYYCGGNWQRPVCTNVYGAAVVRRAAEIQQDINILERD
ncbi:MAG: lytic murein transglycosylase, partial [Candidatus Binatia bacterium]|nr:lytic murein transglycosylase [Candidatus Binatia bacterium]